MNTSIAITNYSCNPAEDQFKSLKIFYAINLILGLPTNGYVVWLIVTGAGRAVVSDLYALNMAVSEILYCLSNVLGIFEKYVSEHVVLEKIHYFCYGLINTSRPLFQCCVCVERYLAVVHPVVFLKYKLLRYKMLCSGLVWLTVLASCSSNIFLTYEIYLYFYLIMVLVLFSVKVFCCLAVLRALIQPGPAQGNRERKGTNHVKRKAFRVILFILVAMIVHYLPSLVEVILSIHFKTATWNIHVYSAKMISFYFILISGFVHPFLYLHRVGKLPFIRGP